MRTLAILCLTAMVAACTPGSAEHRKGATSADVTRMAPSRAPVTTVESNYCEIPHTFLEVGGRSILIPSSAQEHRRVTVQVGDDIHLRATGNCAQSVSAHPQNGRLQVVEEPGYPENGSRYRAARTGVVRLVISMPMCAVPANSTSAPCNGGLRQMGTALVQVMPTAE